MRQLSLDEVASAVLEGKTLGTFKGGISPFKQKAIDTAAGLSKPVVTRRALEKSSGKKLDALVGKTHRTMVGLVRRLRSDTKPLTPSKFKKLMKSTLSDAYRQAYILGTTASGLGAANKAIQSHLGVDEKKWLDSAFKQESQYFEKLLQSIIKGLSLSSVKNRLEQYANAIKSIYESSRVLQLPDESIIHWVLQSNNPCPECRLLHRMSPYTKYTLPTTPKGGMTRCYSRCYCKLRVVKAKKGEVAKVKRKNKSAANLLKKLKTSRKKPVK